MNSDSLLNRVRAAMDARDRSQLELREAIREAAKEVSYAQIGEVLGVSRQRVHQILAKGDQP